MNHSLVDWLSLVAQNTWLYGGAFLLVLGVLVFVHEWGHYIVARMCGVKIESFSVGFGKELFGYTDKRGTRWKFSLVPLGGYVKMFGDVDPASARHEESVKDEETQEIRHMTDAEKSVAFYSQSVGRRAAIVIAGPAINFLFAIIILAGLFTFYGQPVTSPVAVGILSNSAADAAGFQPHDRILSIEGKEVRRFEDIRRAVMVKLDQPLDVKILRGNNEEIIKVTPKKIEERDHFGFKHSKGMLGIIGPGSAVDISQILAVDGVDTTDNPDKARALIKARLGQPLDIKLKGAAEEDVLSVRPMPSYNTGLNDPDSTDYSLLYLMDGEVNTIVKHGIGGSLVEAVRETGDITVSTLEALGQIVTGTRSTSELGGIIRIGAIAGDMAKSGALALISFAALLSINLGLINLFPIPMLDGGHLLFYLIEAIKGSPISERIQEYAFRFGLAILIGIMLFANLNDVVQLVFR